MKRNQPILVAALLASAVVFAPTASALNEREIASVKKQISSVPAAELAAKAAELVTRAPKQEKKDTALAIVKAVAVKNASAMAIVVSAIVTVAPEIAPTVAATAAELLPDQAAKIARIAAQAAPEESEEIVAAVIKINPKAASTISQALAAANAGDVSAAPVTRSTARRSGLAATHSTIRQDPVPINPRRGSFPSTPPVDVSNYAAPGADPSR